MQPQSGLSGIRATSESYRSAARPPQLQPPQQPQPQPQAASAITLSE
jgi:hypothetical protein